MDMSNFEIVRVRLCGPVDVFERHTGEDSSWAFGYHASSGCSDARLSLSESEALQIGRSPCKKCCKARIAI